jgi:hypothetical protein
MFGKICFHLFFELLVQFYQLYAVLFIMNLRAWLVRLMNSQDGLQTMQNLCFNDCIVLILLEVSNQKLKAFDFFHDVFDHICVFSLLVLVFMLLNQRFQQFTKILHYLLYLLFAIDARDLQAESPEESQLLFLEKVLLALGLEQFGDKFGHRGAPEEIHHCADGLISENFQHLR